MRRKRGFSLIELMIVVAIIAILAAISYPSYQSYVVRSNRSAAQQFMLNAANRQEQYMLDRRQYADGTDAEILTALDMSVPDDVDDVYQISFNVNSSPPSFEITASPKAGTVQDGDGNMVLDSDGTNTPVDHWN
jgi:type IV pilus assembly protein PilE